VVWERVYTINEWWDGPRLGVADISGQPHIYASPFNTLKGDFEDYFLVSPIDEELLRLVLEDWEIWIRWSDAFYRKEISNTETHPALPEDQERHRELLRLIGTRLQVDPEGSRKLYAEFRSFRRGWNGLEVQWREVKVERS